jgi:hypothetical protein
VKIKNLALPSTVGLLVIAVGILAYGAASIPKAKFQQQLRDIYPPPPSGWTLKARPIAESAEMTQAIAELLNFDDGFFADYISQDGDRISVYMAYWTPGKMSHRLIATHTPDVCWVGSGWRKDAEAKITNLLNNTDTPVPIGESRTFSANGVPEYVWFWHLVGSRSQSYGTGAHPPWHSVFTDILERGINQRAEQFFIRISSNRTLESQMSGEILPTILTRVPWPKPSSDLGNK